MRISKAPFAKGYPSGERFLYSVERRDRRIYFSALRNGDEENFFGAVISSSAIEERLTLNNLVESASGRATVEVSVQGVTNLPHQVSVGMNGSQIGQLGFNGQSKGQQRFEVPHSLLLEGQNIITLQSANGPSDISLVESIRITYQHTYRAENDWLGFTAKPGETATVSGFSSKDIRVFDVTDESNVQELEVSIEQTKDSYAATVTIRGASLAAPSLTDRKLLALTDEKALQPLAVKDNSPSQLRDATNGAHYIIISKSDLVDSLRPLAALRTKQGLKTALVDIEDIYDEFSFGDKSPQSIRDFLSYASMSWKLRPLFVLLAGDASYDARNYLGLGDNDLVPTKLIDTAYLETASDDWFADFDDDGVANLSLGRLPVRSASDASLFVNKLITYEQSAPSNEMTLAADITDGFNFEQASTALRSLIPSSIRLTEVFRSRSDDPDSRNQLLAAINRGQKIVNYAGHGSVNVLRGNLLEASDSSLFTNRDRLSLFVMMTCLNGYFQDAMNDSLGESLLKSETGGAVAVWASSGLTLPGDQAVLNQELYGLLFNRLPGITIGEAVMRAKLSVGDSDIRRTWILLGDPAMKLR